MSALRTRVTNRHLALLALVVLVGLVALVAWTAITWAQPPIPHAGPEVPGEPGEFPDCLACHQAGVAGAPRLVSDHVAYRNEDCLICHDYLMHPDAAFAHSGLLVGKHVELWCKDCHAGVQRPGPQCDDCHEPPSEPHLGPICEDCHTPAGFEGADWGDFEHPVALEDAHAEPDCSDCHIAGQEVTPECSSCHQPPSEPHFGQVCEECHTPTSFKDASLPAEAHPIPLIGAHQSAACEGCHAEGQEPPEFVCSNCHQPPSEPHYGSNCEECHTPTSFKEARIPAEMHPIPLVGAHETADCAGCHAEGQEPPEFVCSNCHDRPENHFAGECDVCHTPEGFAKSASFFADVASRIAHDLDGRDNCLQCHDPEGQIKPAPSNHAEYINEQCTLCHKQEQ